MLPAPATGHAQRNSTGPRPLGDKIGDELHSVSLNERVARADTAQLKKEAELQIRGAPALCKFKFVRSVAFNEMKLEAIYHYSVRGLVLPNAQ